MTSRRRAHARWLAALTAFGGLTSAALAHADTTVQIPLDGVLDARSVTTLTAGQVVVWTLPTDGGMPMLQNAFATKAIATLKGTPVVNALPDDGKFPADARHPDVVLHFSNDADPASPQTHLVKATDTLTFPVPAATYSKLFLFFNGAAGGTTITVTLMYADGMDTQMAMIPDYYADVSPTDPVIFDLATNLAKWDKNTAISEAGHHNITGAEFHPTAGKMLQSVSVTRAAMGNLVFWGATGIATSDVAMGGAGGAGGGGAAGTGGGGGAAAGTGGALSGGTGGSAPLDAGSGGVAGASLGGGGASSAGTATAGSEPQSTAGTTTLPPATPAQDASCGCRLAAATEAPLRAGWLTLLGLGAALGRRRRRVNAAA